MKKRKKTQQREPGNVPGEKRADEQDLDGLFSPLFDDDFPRNEEVDANGERHELYAENHCVRFSIQNTVAGSSTPHLQLHEEESDQEYRRRKTTDLPAKELPSSKHSQQQLPYSQMQRLQTSKGKRVVKYNNINQQAASRDERKAPAEEQVQPETTKYASG